MDNVRQTILNARKRHMENIARGFVEFEKAEETDFEKARSGVYADTAENRKLGRVGQRYGGRKAEENHNNGDWLESIERRRAVVKKVKEVLDKFKFPIDLSEEIAAGQIDKQIGYLQAFANNEKDSKENREYSRKNHDTLVKIKKYMEDNGMSFKEHKPSAAEKKEKKAAAKKKDFEDKIGSVLNKFDSLYSLFDKTERDNREFGREKEIDENGKVWEDAQREFYEKDEDGKEIISAIESAVEKYGRKEVYAELKRQAKEDMICSNKELKIAMSFVKKGEDLDIEKAEEEDIEKSDLMYAIGNGTIKVVKTGKEIKEQVENIIMPSYQSQLAVKENEANEKLKECGQAPTNDPDPWWTGDVKMDVGYRIYQWRELEWSNPEDCRMYPSLSASDQAEKKGNCPESEAEANARRQYNELVRCICNIKVDIKACEILNTLKDGTEYELTPRQVLTLKF